MPTINPCLCLEETLTKTWFENSGYTVKIVRRDSVGTTFDLTKDGNTNTFVMKSNILETLMAEYLVKVEYRIEDFNTLNRLTTEFKAMLKNETFINGRLK